MKLLIVALLTITCCLLSQAVLIEDDFDDGNADGWLIMYGEGTYFVNDSLCYDISYSGTSDVNPAVIRGDSANIFMTISDYSVLLEGICHAPSDFIGVYMRGTYDETGYVLWLRYDAPADVAIFRHDGPGSYTNIENVLFTLNYDEPYWIRFESHADTLKGKVWQGTVGDEPAPWLLTAVDDAYQNNGFMGFVTGQYDSGPAHAELDNVLVTAVTTALDQTTWAEIKALF